MKGNLLLRVLAFVAGFHSHEDREWPWEPELTVEVHSQASQLSDSQLPCLPLRWTSMVFRLGFWLSLEGASTRPLLRSGGNRRSQTNGQALRWEASGKLSSSGKK